jgi:hemin uptake protein HemP
MKDQATPRSQRLPRTVMFHNSSEESTSPTTVATVASHSLLGESKILRITHGKATYVLRRTALDKLILTKDPLL